MDKLSITGVATSKHNKKNFSFFEWRTRRRRELQLINAIGRVIAFIPVPVVAESLGNWHKVGLEQLRKLGSALGRHTGQEEGETISHLLARASVLLQKGLSALLLSRIPCHPTPAIGAQCV